MPLLTIGHQQYWSPNAVAPAPPPPGGSGSGGYPAWQATVIAMSALLFLLIGV